MLNDRDALRPASPVRSALRTLRAGDGAGPPAPAGDRRLLWQQRLQEFVASAPELREERERAAAEHGRD